MEEIAAETLIDSSCNLFNMGLNFVLLDYSVLVG